MLRPHPPSGPAAVVFVLHQWTEWKLSYKELTDLLCNAYCSPPSTAHEDIFAKWEMSLTQDKT